MRRAEAGSGRRRRTALVWPEFYADLLERISSAFLRRRKAISHHARLTCARDFTESSREAIERLNIELDSPFLRLSVWGDGCLWLGICVRHTRRSKGWAFKDQFHGTALDLSAGTLVALVENTLGLALGSDRRGDRERLREAWALVHPCEG